MKTRPRLATAMNSAGCADVLRTIGMDGVGLAVWSREPLDGFQTWIDGLAADRLPRLRGTMPASRAAEAVAEACDRAATPAGAYRDHLVEDMARLARLAADILSSLLVELRLDVSSGQTCPRWHIDAVRARLLCTYRGPGTEFSPARPDGTPGAIHRLPTGAVGLFRGMLWPGRELAGIVHRLPPADAGATRLVLVIDPMDEAHAC